MDPSISQSSKSLLTIGTIDDEEQLINQQLLNLRQHFELFSSTNKMIPIVVPVSNDNDNEKNKEIKPNQQQQLMEKEINISNELNEILQNHNEQIIYAQVQRKHSFRSINGNNEFNTENYYPNSKLIQFLKTIPSFENQNRKINENDLETLKIYYNIECKSQQSIQFNQQKDYKPILLFNIDQDRKCLSFLKQQQSHNKNSNCNNLKLFSYDHLFTGSLPEKLLSIPKTILINDSLIDTLINYQSLNNAVILAIRDNDVLPKHNDLTTTVNEFQQLIHRGLMMHSIAWIFDAITTTKTNSNNDLNEKTNRNCASSYTIYISALIYYHNRFIDLIMNHNQQDGSLLSNPVIMNNNNNNNNNMGNSESGSRPIRPQSTTMEYVCTDASQATIYLEHALEQYDQIIKQQQLQQSNNKCFNSNNSGEHLFVLTIHIHQYRFVQLDNKNKCKAIGKYKKLHIIDIPLKLYTNDDEQNGCSQLQQVLTALFYKQNLLKFRSKIAQLFHQIFSIQNDNNPRTSLTILANLKQQLTTPATDLTDSINLLIERCQLISSVQRYWPKTIPKSLDYKTNKESNRNRACCNHNRNTTCKHNNYFNKKSKQSKSINVKNPDLESSQASSSEQSFDTVIFCGNNLQQQKFTTVNGLVEQNILKQQSPTNKNHTNCCRQCSKMIPKSNLNCLDDHPIVEKPNEDFDCCNNSNSYHRKSINSKNRSHNRNNSRHNHHRKKHKNNQNDDDDDTATTIWTEELWVDGPKAMIDNEKRNFDQNKTENNCDGYSTIGLNDKKKQQIEQWISNIRKLGLITSNNKNNVVTNTSSITNKMLQINSNRMFDLGFKCLDDSCFLIKNHIVGESSNHSNNLYNINHLKEDEDQSELIRDTLSDCGDRKSDFYDEYQTMWKQTINNDNFNKVRKRILECESKSNAKHSNNHNHLNFDANSLLTNNDNPIRMMMTTTEPPKQLKLEQFLQQLSQITMDNHNQNHGQQICYPKLPLLSNHNTIAMITTENINQSTTSLNNNPLKPKQQKQIIENANISLVKEHQHQQEDRQNEQKLKRNTTSTTTSGHGTISEGECSSIINNNKAKTSSVSTPSYGSNNGVGNNDVSVDGGTTEANLNGSNGVMVVQRQPASSGYESTLQDDDDDDENAVDSCDIEEIIENFTENQQQQQRSIRLWSNKMANIKRNCYDMQSQNKIQVIKGQNGSIKKIKCHNFEDNNYPNLDHHQTIESNNFDKPICSFFCCGGAGSVKD